MDGVIDNGNIYVFCDYVDASGAKPQGCIRGAGHNGDHIITDGPWPMYPVLARSRVSAEEVGALPLPQEGSQHIQPEQIFEELGITPEANVASLQRRLHVGAADAMRLFALRYAVLALRASVSQGPQTWNEDRHAEQIRFAVEQLVELARGGKPKSGDVEAAIAAHVRRVEACLPARITIERRAELWAEGPQETPEPLDRTTK